VAKREKIKRKIIYIFEWENKLKILFLIFSILAKFWKKKINSRRN